MNQYAPEMLVKNSRYRKLFPTLSGGVRKDVYRRMKELLIEEQQWCDKGNYTHIYM